MTLCLLAFGIIDGDPVSNDPDCSDKLSVSLPTVVREAIKPRMPNPLWLGGIPVKKEEEERGK